MLYIIICNWMRMINLLFCFFISNLRKKQNALIVLCLEGADHICFTMRGICMKSHVLFLLLVLFICACSLCSASPLITNGSVTTYIGENNYMYLESADGSLHRLQAPIRDLLGMDAQNLYCLTYDNKIYGVRLDGTSSSLVSAYATPEQINAYRPQPAYTLTDQLLTRASGQLNIALSGTCLAACSNQDAIFYIQQDPATSAVTLHAVPLDAQNVTFTTVLEGMRTVAPLSMTAAKDMVCVLGLDRSIHVYSIAAGALQTIEAAQVTDEIISAVCASGKILTYTADENGYPRIAGSYDLTSPAGLQMIMVSTAVPTFTPSPTPFIITPAPTVRPTATRRPTQVPDPDETIYYGTRGTRVRKMQQRLLNLGYPVGKVDGSFGEQTLFALNLFQDAIGYTNRKSCTEKCYSRLMANSAPKFDLYRPLKKGNRGLSVQLMQKMLILLGYGPDKADGIYGENTSAAVAAFQLYAALPVDGDYASPNTLFALYTLMNPLESPTPTPIPTLTPVPTATPVITAAPTQVPTVEPTEIPTSTPTEQPTEGPSVDPTETPAPESTDSPTPNPVELLTPAPAETSTPEPTEQPTAEPTEKPTSEPTEKPTPEPTEKPTPEPTEKPTEPLVELITPAPAETDAQEQTP